MRVLGVDPGIVTTGYGVLETTEEGLRMVDCGVITASKNLKFEEKLKEIYTNLGQIISHYKPEAVIVEDPFFAKSVKFALRIGQVRGVVVLAGVNAGIDTFGYTPLEMKQAVVGYGRARKEQVQAMVKRLLNLESLPKPEHAADALGIAICHLHTKEFNEKLKISNCNL